MTAPLLYTIEGADIPPLPLGVTEEIYHCSRRLMMAKIFFALNLGSLLVFLLVPIILSVSSGNNDYWWFYGLAFGWPFPNVLNLLGTIVALKRTPEGIIHVPWMRKPGFATPLKMLESISLDDEGVVTFVKKDEFVAELKAQQSPFCRHRFCVPKTTKYHIDEAALFIETNLTRSGCTDP